MQANAAELACDTSGVNNDTQMTSTDTSRFTAAKNGILDTPRPATRAGRSATDGRCPSRRVKEDPRADLDDDGDVDAADQTLFDVKVPVWTIVDGEGPSVAWAFSGVGNWYGFQGVPHLALDTAKDATAGKLLLNHHRARYAGPAEGRWVVKDPLFSNPSSLSPHFAHTSRRRPFFPRTVDPVDATLVPHGELAMPEAFTERAIENLYVIFGSTPATNLDPTGMWPCIPSTGANNCTVIPGNWVFIGFTRIPNPSVSCTCHWVSTAACVGICACVDCLGRLVTWGCVGTPATTTTGGGVTVESDGTTTCNCPAPTMPAGGTCGC